MWKCRIIAIKIWKLGWNFKSTTLILNPYRYQIFTTSNKNILKEWPFFFITFFSNFFSNKIQFVLDLLVYLKFHSSSSSPPPPPTVSLLRALRFHGKILATTFKSNWFNLWQTLAKLPRIRLAPYRQPLKTGDVDDSGELVAVLEGIWGSIGFSNSTFIGCCCCPPPEI